MAARKEIPRELSIYINDRQVINSLGGVTREITKVNAEMRNLNKNSSTYNDDLKKLQTDLVSLKDKQSDFRKEIQSTNEVASKGTETFSKLFIGLTSGDLGMAKEGFMGLKDGLSGMTKSAISFIATPIGAAIAALSGIAIGTKAIFDFNVEAEKSARLIENLTGKTGQVVEDIRVKIQSLTDVFGVEFNSIANAVDNLMDTGAVKSELEALTLIKDGLLTAPDKNEFISSLDSTAVAAKNIGAPLEDIIALKQQIEATGVDPEKSFGAYQKAANNLALQSDKLREKLSGALGAGFTDDILSKIKNGEITTVQALNAIGLKSKEVGLNQTQQAEISKELFGKAGVAAGGYEVLLNNVVEAEKKRTQGLNENQKAQNELVAATERLNKAQSDLFRIEGFGSMWDMIKTKVIDASAVILEKLLKIKNDFQPLIDVVGVAIVWAFKLWWNVVKQTLDAVSAAGTMFQNIFTGIKNAIINNIRAIVENTAPLLKLFGANIDSIKKKLDSWQSKQVTVTTTTDNKPNGDSGTKTKGTPSSGASPISPTDTPKKEGKSAAEIEKDQLLALAKSKAELAKAELDLYIANNKSKLEAGADFTQESLAQEEDRLRELQQKQLDQLQLERDTKIKKAEEEGKSAEEIKVLKQAYDLEYETSRVNLESATSAQISANKKTFEEQQKQLQLEQLQADNELAIAEAETKAQEEQIKQEQDYQAQLARYRKLLSDKAITQEEYDRFIAAAREKQAELDRVRELNQVRNTLSGVAAIGNAAGELFGQSKELALVMAGINGAMAITSILAQYPKFDGGFMMWSAIAASVITTAAQVKEITKAKAPKQPKVPKFFSGGFTGNAAQLGHDEYGPMTGIVHSNEWVAPAIMTQSPRYAPVLSYLENERQKIYGNKFAAGGGTSPSMLTQITQQNSDETTSVMKAILYRLDNPVPPKLSIGYDHAQSIEDLNTERKSAEANGTLS